MIGQLSPNIRKLLAISRARAMQGQNQEALQQLVDYFDDSMSAIEKVMILMLEAEIYYLNGQLEEAMEVYKGSIFLEFNSLPHDFRLIVSDNSNVVAVESLESGSTMEFYRQFDFRRLSGVCLWDTESLIQANHAVEEGKHYDALSAYWQQVTSTYSLGCWRSQKWASARFSKECLMLGWLPEAAHHAIISLDTKLIDEIGGSLLSSQNGALIQATVDKVLSNANLLRHALIACSLFAKISDAIPNNQVDSAFKWLLKLCSDIQGRQDHTGMNKSAWSALSSLASRLNHDQAKKVVGLATESCYWKGTTIYRQYLVQAVTSCVVVLEEELSHLSKLTLPLATDTKSDHDYIDVLSLLCCIAEKSLEGKGFLAKSLYPSTNPYLGQVAKVFGKYPDVKELIIVAEKIAASILLQVQYLNKDDEPKAPAHYFCSTSERDGGKLVVYSASTPYLDTLIRYIELLEPSDIDCLVTAILTMLKEPENMLSNKVYLLKALGGIGARLSAQSAERLFEALQPIAIGKLEIGQMGEMSTDAKNPLNPFKFNDNSPEQVSGMAMYALASIEKASPGLFGSKLDSILESALIDNSPDIRRFAFAALRELPSVSAFSMIGILFGTRDPDPEAAELAFEAIGTKGELLSEENWHQLIFSLSESTISPHKNLRLIAAITISKLMPDAPEKTAQKLGELAQNLRTDICFSVRQSLQ